MRALEANLREALRRVIAVMIGSAIALVVVFAPSVSKADVGGGVSSISAAPSKTMQVRNTANLNMRTGPGTGYRVVRTIPTGTILTSTTQAQGWHKVSHGTHTGWVSGEYLTQVGKSIGSARVRTEYNLEYRGSSYHIYADGINWNKSAGIMYYFDGDYYLDSYSQVGKPGGLTMRAMASAAAKENLVLVTPTTPSAKTTANGFTWWENSSANAKWFREFSGMIERKIKPADGRVWYMGYSGGAEFISLEVAARSQASYKSGGAILLAGGDKPTSYKNPPDAIKNELPMHWFVGSKDRSGQTNPPAWSAYHAAKEGQRFYKNKNFRTTFTPLANLGHHDYDLASIMRSALKKTPPAPIPPPIDWVGFKDLPKTHRFVDEILWLSDQGITTGYQDGTFKPKSKITREAMAALLYRFAGAPKDFEPPSVSAFPDVSVDDAFYTEIAWLAEREITTGYEDGSFKPKNKITREAMAAFLYRFQGKPTVDPPGASPFADVRPPHTFYDEVMWLADTGVTTGYGDGSFKPKKTITREAAAAFLYRLDSL